MGSGRRKKHRHCREDSTDGCWVVDGWKPYFHTGNAMTVYFQLLNSSSYLHDSATDHVWTLAPRHVRDGWVIACEARSALIWSGSETGSWHYFGVARQLFDWTVSSYCSSILVTAGWLSSARSNCQSLTRYLRPWVESRLWSLLSEIYCSNCPVHP